MQILLISSAKPMIFVVSRTDSCQFVLCPNSDWYHGMDWWLSL